MAPLLKWKPVAKLYQLFKQRHILAFYWLDVRPAIQARKRKAQEDIISHLISQNYSDAEILIECVTYAAAGMVTTREFISVAAWHFLEHPALRERYLAAPEEERVEMLHMERDPMLNWNEMTTGYEVRKFLIAI